MDAIEAIRTRRSIRSFRPDPVARALVESVIEDAAFAPPPLRGQVPWAFSVTEGVARVAELGDRAMAYTKTQHRADEPGWGWLGREGFKVFWDAPVLIVVSGRLEDCCRAGTNLMLSAHARGLGTCWVGAPLAWLETGEARKACGVPEGMTPSAVLCLGYAREVPEAPPPAKPTIIWKT